MTFLKSWIEVESQSGIEDNYTMFTQHDDQRYMKASPNVYLHIFLVISRNLSS